MANIIMGVLHNNGGGGECWPGPARAWGLASVQRSTPTARLDAFHCVATAGALWMTSYANHLARRARARRLGRRRERRERLLDRKH